MSLRDVEHSTGIKFGVIAAYERGDRKPSLDTIKKLAVVYGVSPILILFSEEEIAVAYPEEFKANAKILSSRPEINELVTLIQKLPPKTIQYLVNFIANFISPKK